MRYAIYNKAGKIINTFVCDDPDFASSLGGVEFPYPETPNEPTPSPSEQRESAYNTRGIVEWDGCKITVTEAAQLWQYYAAEGSPKADNLQSLIAEAKKMIRSQYPDEEVNS